jgi:hypothetical protein
MKVSKYAKQDKQGILSQNMPVTKALTEISAL